MLFNYLRITIAPCYSLQQVPGLLAEILILILNEYYFINVHINELFQICKTFWMKRECLHSFELRN